MKTLIIIALAFISACAEKPKKAAAIDVSTVEAGTYEGVGNGRNGEIKVNVTVAEGKITDITILENQETPDFANPAFERITNAMIANNSASADAVSGSTMSSEGLVEAVKNALTK